MSNLNKVILIGRLTKEITVNVSGTNKYTRFNLAVGSKRKDANGTYVDDTDFIPCVAWNRIVEILQAYTSKGSLISVEGKWKTGSYEKNGVKQYTNEMLVERLELLDSKPKEEKVEEPEPPAPTLNITSDDLPF